MLRYPCHDVPQSDDKPRGGRNAREASQLRAILGSEPSSGYAFHDAVRVERTRPARPQDRAPAKLGSSAPGASGLPQHDSAGQEAGTHQSAQPSAAATRDVANDQLGSSASWPPLPNDLVGAVEPEVQITNAPRTVSSAPTASSTPPVGVVGGAIWQALPSVVDAAGAAEPDPSQVDAGPNELVLEPAVATLVRNSRPHAWRGSLAERDTDAGAYGDPRLLKYEPLVERTAWEQLQGELSREAELSPVLELLHIIARRETLPNNEGQSAVQLSQEAIATLARLLGVPETSPTALLLGKRLLRKNPGWARERSPGTGLSTSMVLMGIAVGAGIGWLLTRLIL
jgi:hypothetical protein